MKIVKKVFLTVLFPLLMFVAMLVITSNNPACIINGRNIFLGADLMRNLILKTCMTVCVALAIWLQMKHGRFDFSIGAIMILTAIIAGNIGYNARSPFLTLVLCAICGVGLSVIASLLYVLGRLPIIISSIGITLLYESMTYLLFDAQGMAKFYPDPAMNVFGRMPLIFIPAILAIACFVFYDKLSVEGRKGKILSNNQGAGVNSGLNEKKNVIKSYVYSGFIVGMGALIYLSQNAVSTQSGLATTGVMFSYIASVFMGMFVGMASNDVIGILMSSIAVSIMAYGLNCMNLGAGGWQNIIFGVFVLCFYGLTARLDVISALLAKLRKDAAKA